MRDITHHRADERDRRLRHAEPPQDLHLPADDRRAKKRPCAARDRQAARDAGVSRRRRRRRPRRTLMTFYDAGPQGRRLRERHPAGAAGDSREPALPVPPRSRRRRRRKRRADLPHQRHRAGVAAVVLPLGHGARRRAAEGRRAAARCARRRCSRSRCAACSPIRGPRRCRRASRRSGCGCRTSRRFIPTRCCIPYYDDTLGAGAASARPSCSSTASCARTAACSTC